MQFVIFRLVIVKKYSKILKDSSRDVDVETKTSIKKNVYGVFFHKLGSTLINSTDSIIISSFLGVIALGYYSNYTIFCC